MINTYDIDGVINMGADYMGLRPGPNDIIITGRSEDEADYTMKWLADNGIHNIVCFNPIKFEDKTRDSSGHHKASVINELIDKYNVNVGLHFEDDPVQADIIERLCPRVKVVRIVHDLVEKENVWHGPTDDESSSGTDS